MDIQKLQRWFLDHVTIGGEPYRLDDEQAAVVLDEHKNTIVTARAGSGKTHTLVAKITYLIAKKQVRPGEILALGFNTEPQADFRKRLFSIKVDGRPICDSDAKLARTFHSLACDFEYSDTNILAGADRDKYIREILDKVVDPKNIYAFVRDDSHEPKRDDYNNDKDYYSALKYTRYETLNGDKVKSRCEKIISDYLFEHDINFKYEPISFYPARLAKYANAENRRELEEYDKITPDYVLYDNGMVVWEHWGISGNETEEEKIKISKSGIIGNYYDYQKKQKFKEMFYGGEWLDNDKIQTEEAKNDKYLSDFLKIKATIYTHFEKDEKRDEFEQKISSSLKKISITNKKLSEDTLLAKFKNIAINIQSTAKRVTQFIDRAEQQFPGNINRLKKACKKTKDEQVKKFYAVCLLAYEYYLRDLNEKFSERFIDKLFPFKRYNIDYNILLNNATKNIQSGKNGKNIDIDRLKYIFLDEYQDFSLLFHNLIKAICERNKNIHILAVGDDWQAINSYMGASLEYFNDFEKYFPEDVTRMSIATNRRSVESIVEAANEFMKNSLGDEDGASAIKPDTDEATAVNDCVVYDVHDFYAEDGKVAIQNSYQKYNLMLAEIVKENAGKSIRFLNRTHDFKISDNYKEDLEKFKTLFEERYQKYLTGVDFENDINFATVNTSKGTEADVVVILESDIGRFPVFHPDNYLYEVFGDTEQKAIDEQKRLFYVAITRAKEKLYILHKNDVANSDDAQNGSDADFLRLMKINKYNHYEKDTFLPLETQIKRGQVKKIAAISIKFTPNKYEPEKIDVLVISRGGDKVRQYKAFANGKSVLQLKPLQGICSKEHPVVLNVDVTPEGKYKNQYIRFYRG